MSCRDVRFPSFSLQDLTAFNTLGLASCARVAVVASEAQVPALCAHVQAHAAAGTSSAPFVLGGGSNVVMASSPSRPLLRVALRGRRLWQETPDHWVVEAAAGESWHALVRWCLDHGWPGLENLALIPGQVGAAPVQNIGAYGLELAERLHSVVAWDLQRGSRHEFGPQACAFAYRDSRFKRAGPGRWLITRVRLALPRRWEPRLGYAGLREQLREGEEAPEALDGVDTPAMPAAVRKARQVFEAVCHIRRHKLPDPAVLANAGSFFKNPVVAPEVAARLGRQFPGMPAYPQPDHSGTKLAAGWLIEQAGWKGRRLGPVGMHARQALVLVNHGGASAADVHALARAVQADVQARFGVRLEQEPVDVG